MFFDLTFGSNPRRQLLFRDALSILSLTLVTAVLFGLTLALFRSFAMHRAELAHRWSQRAGQALASGRPRDAIADLRTALSYAPDTRAYELLLAQALMQAGETEQAYNYFMELHETEPGNGLINLELARLSVQRKRPADAEMFYRAAIFGTWETGDGLERRGETRLELARYLIGQRQFETARMELLVAGGNAPETFPRELEIARLLERTGDAGDAWIWYQKALSLEPDNASTLVEAGRLAYEEGDYEDAHSLFDRAQDALLSHRSNVPPDPAFATLRENAARILELMPAQNLSARERIARILVDREIAHKRLDACTAANGGELPTALQPLVDRWNGPDGKATASAMLRDPARADSTLALVYSTEIQTNGPCGVASGDDGLLVKLASTPRSFLAPAFPASGERSRDALHD